MAASIPAVVTYPPSNGKFNMRYEHVNLARKIEDHEVLVRMTATGICHTDIFAASLPTGLMGTVHPSILGHEGAGYVEEVGSKVTAAKVGDPVILSYDYCGHCDLCTTDRPSYCMEFSAMNVFAPPYGDVFTSAKDESKGAIQGKFFGQSSFAGRSIVSQNSVVNVKELVKDDEELKLLAPLGCGLQTGAGAVIISGEARPNDAVVITGLGGVGLGALMAAKVAGCKSIIAVDRIASRLQVAKELGATHLVDTSDVSDAETFVSKVQAAVDNARISLAIETTGVTWLADGAIAALGKRGKFIQIGIPHDAGGKYTVPISQLYGQCKVLEGNILGNAVAKEFVPRMIGWYREGKFPVEKLVKFFDAKDVQEALDGMEGGAVVKPVLVW